MSEQNKNPLIEAFLKAQKKTQLNEKIGIPAAVREKQKQTAADTKMTTSISAREPTEAPSSLGAQVKQGLGNVDAAVRKLSSGMGGDYVAASGDYLAKKALGKDTTFSKELEQEKEKGQRAELNYPIGTKVGAIADTASTVAGVAGLGKAAIKQGVKLMAKKADDVIKPSAPQSTFDKYIKPLDNPSTTRIGEKIPSNAPPKNLNATPTQSVPPVGGAAKPAEVATKGLTGLSKFPLGKAAAIGAGVVALTAAGSKPAGDVKATPTAPTEQPTKYKINKGDTLSDIARKNKVSVGDLMKANQGIKDVNKIGAGQELIIPKATNKPIYQGGIGTKAGPQKSQNLLKPKMESTEMSNKLIEAFKKLHSINAPNLFEAAKKLDKVGKEDKDIDNDGDADKSDSYLHNRRKKIAAAMKEAIDPKIRPPQKDPNAEGMVKAGEKAPEMVPNPEYATKPDGVNRSSKTSLPQSVTDKMKGKSDKLKTEEVEFSEAELDHLAAVLEEGRRKPGEEPKKRGRKAGVKIGSYNKLGGSSSSDGSSEPKNLAAQIRFAAQSGANDGKGNYMLKHPKTGVTKAVPVKAATEFYSKYSGAEKPADKSAHHDAFLAKHFGSENTKPKSNISLPKIPGPRS
jgi:LysM repeat protein